MSDTTDTFKSNEVFLTFDGIDKWGHRIRISDDSISCRNCDMDQPIPELISRSSDFRQAVYKLYLLGKFKHKSCERPTEQSDKFLDNKTYTINNVGTQYQDSSSVLKLETGDGDVSYHRRDHRHQSSANDYDEGDMMTEQQFMDLCVQSA